MIRSTHGHRRLIISYLDNAGKTTILYKLSLGEVVVSQATVGSNVETVKHKGMTLEIWDLGGQQSLRSAWTIYYKGADVVILVIDSTDRARIGVSKGELQNLLENPDLSRSPVLILANKQDMKDAMSPEETSAALGLHTIRDHDWHIQPCCALTGQGLNEALTWIHGRLATKKC
jgi:ADP-ribosylation factor-like protein 5B